MQAAISRPAVQGIQNQEKRIAHAPYNKIDGLMHLKLLFEERKLPGMKVENFSFPYFMDLKDIVLDPNRKGPLLVRTSFTWGEEATYSEWVAQPRRKFPAITGKAAEKKCLIMLNSLMNDVSEYWKGYRKNLYAIAMQLPDVNVASIGQLVTTPSRDAYRFHLKEERYGLNTQETFRDASPDYLESGWISTGKVKSTAGFAESQFPELLDVLRNAVKAIAGEEKVLESEVDFAIYGGTIKPVAYDWLVTDETAYAMWAKRI